ncbi:hypothetical protein ABFV51_27585, partial [Pseudomonas asgharzadehiana]|uniref:hypothetical protein n=1 Tax=Pseudomonas asgharzadehiana TaxID=2842349 RepID=UPI0034D4FFF7
RSSSRLNSETPFAKADGVLFWALGKPDEILQRVTDKFAQLSRASALGQCTAYLGVAQGDFVSEGSSSAKLWITASNAGQY